MLRILMWELVKPVLNCMDDTDSRVRFYACESLYNVTKVARYGNSAYEDLKDEGLKIS